MPWDGSAERLPVGRGVGRDVGEDAGDDVGREVGRPVATEVRDTVGVERGFALVLLLPGRGVVRFPVAAGDFPVAGRAAEPVEAVVVGADACVPEPPKSAAAPHVAPATQVT
ncbi:hypothetical protein, partial [Nonomuraea dietziae]